MCGFALEIIKKNRLRNYNLVDSADKVQYFRGPDQKRKQSLELGEYHLEMIHHRLSINDLSDNGIQPMFSFDKKFCILFNGEVYNHKYLWKKYISKESQSTCDTRLLVEIISLLGIKNALQKIDWCGSLTIIDFQEISIFFIRDSFGEKPLYFYQPNPKSLMIASEIKSILNSSLDEKLQLNLKSISCYLRDGVLELNGETFFKQINAFKPGFLYSVSLKDESIKKENYHFNFSSKSIKKEKFFLEKSNFENAENLRNLLKVSIKERLSCDVKTGILFSGGIDSSIIASFSDKNTPLFSYIGGDEKDNRSIKTYQKTFNREIKFVSEYDEIDLVEKLKKLTYILDYPLTGASLFCFEEIVKTAKKNQIKVLLSGQGADELFLGYKKYRIIYLFELFKKKFFLKFFKNLIFLLKNGFFIIELNLKEAKSYIPYRFRSSIFNKNVDRIGKTFKNISSLKTIQEEDINKRSIPVLCHYEDRIAMHYGIEMRLPYLSKKIYHYALSIPPSISLSRGWSKYILRLSSAGSIPKEIQWRKDKKGFTNPESRIIKQGLLDWVKNKLKTKSCLVQKYNLINIKNLFEEIKNIEKSKPYDHNREFFRLVALEIWFEINKEYITS